MKLSLVEPFAARPVAEPEGQDAVNRLSSLKLATPKVENNNTGDNLTEGEEESPERRLMRFLDYVAKINQEVKPPERKTSAYVKNCIITYKKQQESVVKKRKNIKSFSTKI